MPVVDLTAEELALVEAIANRVKKDVSIYLAELLQLSEQKIQKLKDRAPAGMLASINQKLTDNNEEVNDVKVRTIRMMATANFPTQEQVWATIKEVI